jgi:TRAP-type C4-dicarboxylate transport system permease small subunit
MSVMEYFLKAAVVGLMAVQDLPAGLHVFARYVLNNPAPRSEEAAFTEV